MKLRLILEDLIDDRPLKTMYFKIDDYGTLQKLHKTLEGLKQYVTDGSVFLAGIGNIYIQCKGRYNGKSSSDDRVDYQEYLNQQYPYRVKSLTLSQM